MKRTPDYNGKKKFFDTKFGRKFIYTEKEKSNKKVLMEMEQYFDFCLIDLNYYEPPTPTYVYKYE